MTGDSDEPRTVNTFLSVLTHPRRSGIPSPGRVCVCRSR